MKTSINPNNNIVDFMLYRFVIYINHTTPAPCLSSLELTRWLYLIMPTKKTNLNFSIDGYVLSYRQQKLFWYYF